jgi:FkbM family methyltransferase
MVKEALRRVLPSALWARGQRGRARLDAARARIEDVLVAGTVAAARGLTIRRALALREGTARTARLDYDRATIMMTLDARSELYRLRSCEKEPETRAWIEKEFQPGDVLYDVGANVGAYSFVAHAVTGGACTVYAFEPGFNTFAALSRNILLNHFEAEIIALPIALAERPGLPMLRYSSVAPGASMHEWVDGGTASRTRGNTLTTMTLPLDQVVTTFGLRPPTHIKLDTDGAELSVLRGAGAVLEAPSLRALLVEIDEMTPDAPEITHCLENAGFRLTAHHPRRSAGLWNCEFVRP